MGPEATGSEGSFMALAPPHLFVRADGGTAIGLGHAMRCLALAHAWRERGGGATWLIARPDEPIRRRIEAAGARCLPLDAAHPDPHDAAAVFQAIERFRRDAPAGQPPPWLLIDGHAFDAAYLATARAACRTLVVDDNGWLPRYDCDVLLNPNVGQSADASGEGQIAYRAPADTVRLFGPDYVLLRPEFARWRGWRREVPPLARRLLVTLGGSDPANVTPLVVRALSQLDLPEVEARIVVGPAHARPADVSAAVAEAAKRLGDRGGIELLSDPADVPELMAWADLCVTAAGSVCWELAFMGLPALTIVVAKNQARSVQAAERAGLLVNLGPHAALDERQIAAAVRKLCRNPSARAELGARGRALVDGRGVERVLALLFDGQRQ
jgi:UDP-2,4-diacetamido-2,4,6-trideoxy-beta-L-altropyranose hydrolase